jgi:predicted 2-oxoglutarate/Fe(II)-dependent dioxygenase YbiX
VNLDAHVSSGASRPVARSSSREIGPVVVRNVFSNSLCARLVADFEATGGDETGFAGADGKDVVDHAWKRRKDSPIRNGALHGEIRECFTHLAVPMLKGTFKLERSIVSKYEVGGHFGPHRDNGTEETKHRLFGVSVGLNDDYHGGMLGFPELRRYLKLPRGAMAIFPAEVLHAVSPVTAGARYVYPTFFCSP